VAVRPLDGTNAIQMTAAQQRRRSRLHRLCPSG
jgi:hypothetical protein